jgi:hypothetical protein
MDNEIIVTGWNIYHYGDPSVGIFGEDWKLEGEMNFMNKEDLNNFRKELIELFENFVTDFPLHVETFEELEQMEKDLLQIENEIEESEKHLDDYKDLYSDIDAEIQKDAERNFE